jgi:hypothetical protein
LFTCAALPSATAHTSPPPPPNTYCFFNSPLPPFRCPTHQPTQPRCRYDKFIVQQLVGGRLWGLCGSSASSSTSGSTISTNTSLGPSSEASSDASRSSTPLTPAEPPLLASAERAYHMGTIPNAKGQTYVFDLRMMVCADDSGFKPCSLYARRAAAPLMERSPGEEAQERACGLRSHLSSVSSYTESMEEVGEAAGAAGGAAGVAAGGAAGGAGGGSGAKAASESWRQLGTNLSVLSGDLTWTTESERLIQADVRDFAILGLGVDDLIDAFVQSVLGASPQLSLSHLSPPPPPLSRINPHRFITPSHTHNHAYTRAFARLSTRSCYGH